MEVTECFYYKYKYTQHEQKLECDYNLNSNFTHSKASVSLTSDDLQLLFTVMLPPPPTSKLVGSSQMVCASPYGWGQPENKTSTVSQEGGGKQKAGHGWTVGKVLRLCSVFKAFGETRGAGMSARSSVHFWEQNLWALGAGSQFYTKKTCRMYLMLLKGGVALFPLVAVATGNRLPYLAGDCEVEAG